MSEMDEIEKYLRMYCAMWPDRALALVDLADGHLIPAATRAAFCAQGLLLTDGPVIGSAPLTPTGRAVLERINRIISGTFCPPPSPLMGILLTQLTELKPGAAARTRPAKAHGLKKAELQALREILLRPGQAYSGLDASYSGEALRRLRLGLLISEGAGKYDRVTPTAKAEALMVMICGQLFTEVVGIDAAAEPA